MKRHLPTLKIKAPKVELSNEEIMRDLLFPAGQQPRRRHGRAAARR